MCANNQFQVQNTAFSYAMRLQEMRNAHDLTTDVRIQLTCICKNFLHPVSLTVPPWAKAPLVTPHIEMSKTFDSRHNFTIDSTKARLYL